VVSKRKARVQTSQRIREGLSYMQKSEGRKQDELHICVRKSLTITWGNKRRAGLQRVSETSVPDRGKGMIVMSVGHVSEEL